MRAAAGSLSLAELGDLAAALHACLPEGGGDVRAAAVASRPDELDRALDALEAALEQGAERLVDAESGIAVGSGTAARVGFLFSGQGAGASVDGGMLARRFGFVRDLYAESQLEAVADPVETAFAQPAIVTASLAGLALLRRLGVEADVALGHSLGELTALHWAGALDPDELVDLARVRGRAMSELGDRDGAMAGIGADEGVVARLAEGTGAVVAGVNGPAQTVVSGAARAVVQVIERAAHEGLSAPGSSGVAVVRGPFEERGVFDYML